MIIQGEKTDLTTLERMCLANDPAIALLDNKVILALVRVARAAKTFMNGCPAIESVARRTSELEEALKEVTE